MLNAKQTAVLAALCAGTAFADVNAQDWQGRTALHFAVRGSMRTIQPLMDAGADPMIADDYGQTPISQVESMKHLYPIRKAEVLAVLKKKTTGQT
ncbi:hypothetical protein NLG97_g10046 [Lecanicillium saksenae]|uniref:Uncharacterized protein n=1 Tax=Lecanicillium saksenae TaxID=468837 RepID=A0ACC1QGS5_9HYPO|nr:hypothetical protein NLG97_g10046 [Lecanicillium saksenae]